jgi:hypothetical protein
MKILMLIPVVLRMSFINFLLLIFVVLLRFVLLVSAIAIIRLIKTFVILVPGFNK